MGQLAAGGKIRSDYADRKQQSLPEEISAIAAYHGTLPFLDGLKTSDIGPNRLRIEYKTKSATTTPKKLAVAGAAVVGVLAAVAVPAFVSYMNRASAMEAADSQ